MNLEELLTEFVREYASQPRGVQHFQHYTSARAAARENYQRVLEAEQNGQDYTDLVLDRLLPHVNTGPNRERGVWIHVAPAVTKDVRTWHQGAGWKKAEEWPDTARAVLKFVRRCLEHPDHFEEACQEFDANPMSRGLQSGMLTPILNALEPERYLIWNNKSRRLLNDIQGTNLAKQIVDYPEANRSLTRFIDSERPLFQRHLPEMRPSDAFDCLSHYYSLRKPAKREPVAWKISPGAQAWQWEECLRDGFIALGWDEFEDLSNISREEFEQRRDELISAQALKGNETGSEQLWSFVSEVQEGDHIVANLGRSTVLGIGRVTGPYTYSPEGDQRHRRSVSWDDTRRRSLPPQPWLQTLIRLKPEEFQAILQSGSPLPPELASLFESAEEARWAFALVGRLVRLLGVPGNQDPRVAFTSPFRLSFGNWPVLDLDQGQLRVALLRDQEIPGALQLQAPFAQPDGRPEIGMVILPRAPLTADQDEILERSMERIGEIFLDYQGSSWQAEHRQDWLEAALDPAKLDRLLGGTTPPPIAVSSGYLEPDFQAIVQSIRQEGLRLAEGLLRRYHVGLKTRGFVILSGISGSGKTWLAEAYAKSVGARRLIVPVAPNWTTNEDLLGYRNPLDGQYHDTPFSHFLRAASAEADRAAAAGENPVPHHLILDEMNLARVEYYFARFLSQMEIRARGGDASIELGSESIRLGRNLLIVGTVNIDETTHGFADKVYDRAQLIETEVTREELEAHLAGASYGDPLLRAWDTVRGVAPFGFRVLDDLTAYISHSQMLGVSVTDAVDEQMLQKVLPKFRGGDPRLIEALESLRILAEEQGWRLTLTKLREMLDCHERHGLVSFFHI